MKAGRLETLLFFIKGYKKYIFGVSIFSILFAIFEGLNVAILFPIISSVINSDVGSNMNGGRVIQILNSIIRIIPIKDMFIATCIFLIVIVILKNIFRYLCMVMSAFASYRIWEDIQNKLFSKYINADYEYFLNHKQGEMVYRLYNAPASAGGTLKLIPQLLTEALKVFIIGVMLFSMSFSVTCGIVVIAAIFYIFTGGLARKISYFLGKGRTEAAEEQNVLINEMISGIKQIRVFIGENRWVLNFHKAVDKYFKLAKKDILWINLPISVLEIFALSALSIFLIFLKRYSPDNFVSNLPLVGVFGYAFQRIMPSLSVITNTRMQIMGDMATLEILHSVLIEEMSHLKDGEIIVQSFNNEIKFCNVSFSYPGRSEVLNNISVSFEKNKCIAIVGQSGSGKTTMVNLIIRLFNPTQGAVIVDGVNLKDCKKDSWLGKISFVSQDTFIFHASVRDNITFGLENISIEDIVNAAKIANAHDFILNLSSGYDTVVGERGMKLSGGEQQRLSIARAILRKPQILIFDEATSALDNVSQSLIQSSINKIVKNHTVILIAHRLSTIVNADKIIVLDKGLIREIGTHDELITKKMVYWKLYNNEQ